MLDLNQLKPRTDSSIAVTIETLGLRRVRSDPALPDRADVVIIGGGIIGVSAAWHLARAGVSVVLCEKGIIAGEQSGRNWGWCRNTLRHPAEIPLMLQSMRDWRDPSVFGQLDTGFRTTGIAYITYPDLEAEQSRWLDAVCAFGLDSRFLAKKDLDRLVPGNRDVAIGALYTASDGCAEPDRATAALAQDARRLGASIQTTCAVRGIETSAGQLSAVVTEAGTIRCSTAILAAGIWSRLFAGSHGISFPQLKVLGSVSLTAPKSGGPDVSVAARRYGWRKRLDGGYVLSRANATYVDVVPDSFRLAADFMPLLRKSIAEIRFRIGGQFIREASLPSRWSLDQPSPFEMVRVADPAPVANVLDKARNAIGKDLPFFADSTVVRKWGGYIDVTPDALPAIGPLHQVPGLLLASGFSGHGFGIGPGAGRLVAQMAMGQQTCVDAASFSPARFALGSRH